MTELARQITVTEESIARGTKLDPFEITLTYNHGSIISNEIIYPWSILQSNPLRIIEYLRSLNIQKSLVDLREDTGLIGMPFSLRMIAACAIYQEGAQLFITDWDGKREPAKPYPVSNPYLNGVTTIETHNWIEVNTIEAELGMSLEQLNLILPPVSPDKGVLCVSFLEHRILLPLALSYRNQPFVAASLANELGGNALVVISNDSHFPLGSHLHIDKSS